MRLVVDDIVRDKLDEFYRVACLLHETLDEREAMAKKNRLLSSLKTLEFCQGFRKARRKREWIVLGCHEFVSEGFIFAYRVNKDFETGELFVWVCDMVYGSLYK